MWWNFRKRKTAALPYSLESWEALQYWKDKQAVFVDVRSREEYSEGHVPESLSLPLDQLSQRYKEIPRQEMVIVICQSSNRSKRAVDFLRRHGYRQAFYMLGGLKKWTGVIIK